MLREQSPRELSSQFGYTSLEASDLIALVLRTGSVRDSVYSLSKEIAPLIEKALADSISSQRFLEILLNKVRLGNAHRHVVLGLYELLRRQNENRLSTLRFTKPAQIVEHFNYLTRKRQEHIVGLYLSPRFSIVHKELLAKGTTDAVMIDIRDVLYFGIKHRVRHIVLLHNHPTGDPTPSKEDIEQTKRIVAATQLVSMVLVDHIIIGKEGYYSFKESTSML